jgi:hypothetical protein
VDDNQDSDMQDAEVALRPGTRVRVFQRESGYEAFQGERVRIDDVYDEHMSAVATAPPLRAVAPARPPVRSESPLETGFGDSDLDAILVCRGPAALIGQEGSEPAGDEFDELDAEMAALGFGVDPSDGTPAAISSPAAAVLLMQVSPAQSHNGTPMAAGGAPVPDHTPVPSGFEIGAPCPDLEVMVMCSSCCKEFEERLCHLQSGVLWVCLWVGHVHVLYCTYRIRVFKVEF